MKARDGSRVSLKKEEERDLKRVFQDSRNEEKNIKKRLKKFNINFKIKL